MSSESSMWVRSMQQEWDERAREDPQYYVCTDVPPNREAFLLSGRIDYARHLRAFLLQIGFDPCGKTALEIGCGLGRMTRCFAKDFARVIALDISPEMILKARGEGLPNTQFLVGSGHNLRSVEDHTVDLAFSYIVFQHIPDRRVILEHFSEIGRVLRQGGWFHIHVNGLPYIRVGPWLIEGYVSRSQRIQRLGLARLPLLRRRQLGSWLGHPISVADLRLVCRQSGLRITNVTGRWTEEQWVSGTKS